MSKVINDKEIAILLATYNGEKYLAAQLNSLIWQSYRNFKVYISDDCSTDGTLKIINQFLLKYPNFFVLLNTTKKFGNPRDNFLFLVENVVSNLYMFSDQDDVWHSDKLKEFIKVYNFKCKNNKPVVVYSDLEVVDSKLELKKRSFNSLCVPSKKNKDWKYYIQYNDAPGCAMMINFKLVNIYLKNKELFEIKNIRMHDWFFITLASMTGDVLYINKQLVYYRQHENNTVGATINRRYSLRLIACIMLKNIQKKDICLTIKQVKEIIKCDEIKEFNEKNLRIVQKYVAIYDYSKISRFVYYLNNKMFFYRNLIELLFFMRSL